MESSSALERLLATATTNKTTTTVVVSTVQTASELVVTEWIVFGFSMASFLIIVFYVMYEILHPLANHERYKELTKIEYGKRYNRELYERIKPPPAS